MGEIVFAGFVPHPPLIVKEIGGREIEKVKKTVNAIEEWAESLASQEPDVLIFITSCNSFPGCHWYQYGAGTKGFICFLWSSRGKIS